MKIKKIEGYKCNGCDEIFVEYQDAEACCPPEEYEVWQCCECGILHEYEQDAEECCR